jgi:hypothetical protein
MTKLVEFRDQRLHHVEHRFVDGGIHHLAETCPLSVMQRRQRSHAGVHRGQRITDADAHA